MRTWREFKIIRGIRYLYERTYLGTVKGRRRQTSKYIGKGGTAGGWQWTIHPGICFMCRSYVPQLCRHEECGMKSWVCNECSEEHDC
jgi:hypothetical protein